jgi:hypothetical protein
VKKKKNYLDEQMALEKQLAVRAWRVREIGYPCHVPL